ncbi:MAG TPA: fluoride efflux transporter CrcB [Candidatus Binatia bacterium]
MRDGFEATRFLLVCLGGAAGTALRYLVVLGAPALLGQEFPWGTLIVNVVGSLLIGVVMHLGLTTDMMTATTRITLATGMLGGFTTYSSFNYETLRFCQQGAWGRALLNVGVTLVTCALAGVAGFALARRIAGAG